jgi:hypothetical protein
VLPGGSLLPPGSVWARSFLQVEPEKFGLVSNIVALPTLKIAD